MNTLLAAALFTAALAGPPSVEMNGKVISRDVKVFAGKPYISLNDIAKSLRMTVQKTAAGYKLITAGGANQLAARYSGGVGDEIFTGKWKFTVVSVKRAASYKYRYNGDDYTSGPKRDGNELVVVECRVKNGNPTKEVLYLRNAVKVVDQAMLTDDQEHSFEAMEIDAKIDYYLYGVWMLPGSATEFVLLFSVPKETKLKQLVYQIARYEDFGDPKKRTTIRINL